MTKFTNQITQSRYYISWLHEMDFNVDYNEFEEKLIFLESW